VEVQRKVGCSKPELSGLRHSESVLYSRRGIAVNEKFLKLNSEKQRKMLQAICEEFTEHSYEDASTNRIVDKAGISKGTLFNYFGCKEGMYHALLRYVLDFFKGYAIDGCFETGDFIERCRLLADMDMRIYQEAPYMINFFATIFTADQTQIPADITEAIGILLSDAMEKLYDDVDYSLFRTDVDATILMKMIRFTFDGYMKEIMVKMQMDGLTAVTMEAFMVDYYIFLKEMKKIYYKKEVLANV
jgi:AcrR family transcriptional regulator